MQNAAQVSSLFLYPIKSCAALAQEQVLIEPRGAATDRRWMLVDDQGRFVTGRLLGALVRLHVEPVPSGLEIRFSDESIAVDFPDANAPRRTVQIWKDSVDSACCPEHVDAWLSSRLGRELHLVFMDAKAHRPIVKPNIPANSEVSFADGYPLLLIGQSSLDDLSSRLGETVDIRRFRPNIVIQNAPAFAEDNWKQIRIDAVVFDIIKPCVRCVFTTVDPVTGERDPRGEPLATLKTYRRSGDGVNFGVNIIPRNNGRIAVGADVEILA